MEFRVSKTTECEANKIMLPIFDEWFLTDCRAMFGRMARLLITQRKSQGLSITTIIVAVIGLIILVVLVAMLTGRLGGFSKGVGEAGSCEKLCEVTGKSKDPTTRADENACETAGGQYRAGNFDDVTSGVCCCT